jgi:hypothetical protein
LQQDSKFINQNRLYSPCGEPGALIVGWQIDRPTYRAFPVLADGRLGPELNLRVLFEQYDAEVR